MATDQQPVDGNIQIVINKKLAKLFESADCKKKPELNKLKNRLRNGESSLAIEEHDIEDIYPVLEYLFSSTRKKPSDKSYAHCPGLTPLLINANEEALKIAIEKLKLQAETCIASGDAPKLFEVVNEKLFYFGDKFCRKDIKSTTKNFCMPETQNVGCVINFMAYMLLEEEHEFIFRALKTNSELASLKVTEFEALNMPLFHLAILMDSQKDKVVSECVEYMLQHDKNNKLERLMKQAGNSKQQTHPTDEITSLALAIAFTSNNNTLIQKLIDVYEDITDSSFTNCLSEEFTYLLLKYYLTTDVEQFEVVLRMFEPDQNLNEEKLKEMLENSTETETQLHAYKALTEKYEQLSPHYSLLEHTLLDLAGDEAYKKTVKFLTTDYIKTVLMSSREEESCLFVRLASAKKAQYSKRLDHILKERFITSKGFDDKFNKNSQHKIHREIIWESLTQDTIILLNGFLDRFVVTNEEEGAHKCALVYYNLIDREGSENQDEHGRKYNNGKEEAENLLVKLREVGYKTIKKEEDWKAEKLKESLETHLKEVKQQCSLVMVFIMAHGTSRSVQGVNKQAKQGKQAEKLVSLNWIANKINEHIPEEIPKVMIVQSCAGKLLKETCQIDQQKWTNFIIWKSVQEGETIPRNQFIPVLMDKLVEQRKELETCEFKEFVTEVRMALNKEYPDETKRGDAPVTATVPFTHESMIKKLLGYEK